MPPCRRVRELRLTARGFAEAPSCRRSHRLLGRLLGGLLLDQPHEQLFQAIGLGAHRQHFDPGRRETLEDLVQVLFLGNFDFERVIVGQGQAIELDNF